MKDCYKKFYNEDTKKVEVKTFLVSNEFDFSNDPETNIDEYINQHSCDKENCFEDVQKINEKLSSGSLNIFKCKECGIYFYTNNEEKEWYLDRGLNIPKRCQRCRKAKKK